MGLSKSGCWPSSVPATPTATPAALLSSFCIPNLYFRYPTQRELRAAGLYWEKVRNSQGLLGDGLDVRGEGGYVVAPSSRTLRAYEWSDNSPPASPSWLLGCLRAAETGEALF